jgi:serine phosphatase RsbU (regulator of sigma subunit)
VQDRIDQSIEELENFEEIAKELTAAPGDLPSLDGIDIFGQSLPLNGLVGGDHIIYVDFKQRYDLDARIKVAASQGRTTVVENLERCKTKAGIAIADVSGHKVTDALLALMLHQSFLLGACYELDSNGTITTHLFENLNTRFYNSSSVSKFVTLIYGEIGEDGRFEFISAAHPVPVVFSREFDRIVDISESNLTTFPPIGTMPSAVDIDRSTSETVLGFKDKYEVNEISLMGSGDIMILYSDGLSEFSDGTKEYFPEILEATLREVKNLPAEGIFEAVRQDLLRFSNPTDDISFVVIKRN